MTGHLIGQFQHPKVKVISVNTRHGDRGRRFDPGLLPKPPSG